MYEDKFADQDEGAERLPSEELKEEARAWAEQPVTKVKPERTRPKTETPRAVRYDLD